MFYSKSTNGFYTLEVHTPEQIPADVVEITKEEHEELLQAQSMGKQIKGDVDGKPVAVLPPEPTATEIQLNINSEALAYLSSTDWLIIRQQETGATVPPDITSARAEARIRIVK